MRLIGIALVLLAPTVASADATLTRQRGAPALAVDGVGVPVGAAVTVAPGPHRLRVGSDDDALAGAVLLVDRHTYEFRRNPCSGSELRDTTAAPVASLDAKSVTLVARQRTSASVNAAERAVVGASVVDVAVSAMCPAAPIFITAGAHTVVAFVAPGQHAVVAVDDDAGPRVVLAQAPPTLQGACASSTRVAVVENAPAAAAHPADTPGMQWVQLLRAAGCTVVRGPERARQVRTQNAVFAREPAPALAAALGATEAPLDWPSDVDVVVAVATAPAP